MKNRRLLFCFFILLCLLGFAGPVRAALLARETPLTASVTPSDLNLDSQGVLWVSDADAGAIRAVNTASGAYTIYPVGGSPSDARSNGAGTVWWADFNSNQLSRLTTGNNMTTTWEIPGNPDSAGLWGTALDQSGQVWASAGTDPYLYRLDPVNNNLCTYTLPNSGVGEYLLPDQGRIWLGDSVNGRIVRLEGTTFTWWNLPTSSQPRDLALDGSGRVWWTDLVKDYVGRLDPVANRITTFTPPTPLASGIPQMLTLAGGKVWYSQQFPSRVVRLDPAAASGISATVTVGSSTASPSCSTLPPLAPISITPVHGQSSWNVTTYATLIDQAGWLINEMPLNAAPYGIAGTDQIWLVDQGRQVLAKVSPSLSIYLPMIIKS